LAIADWLLNRVACFNKSTMGNWKSAIEDQMYRRPKFLEVLHKIREDMSREADLERVRQKQRQAKERRLNIDSESAARNNVNDWCFVLSALYFV
jgi:hypothetical protein